MLYAVPLQLTPLPRDWGHNSLILPGTAELCLLSGDCKKRAKGLEKKGFATWEIAAAFGPALAISECDTIIETRFPIEQEN